ncbi:hypothetical protein ACQJBY_037241 [Aegilops geniculata]
MRDRTLRPYISAAGRARPLLRDDTNRPEAESPPQPGFPPSPSWSAPRPSRGTTRSLSARPSLPRSSPCHGGAPGAEKHSGAGDAGVLLSPKVVRPIVLNFEERTPVKERPSPARSSTSVKKSTTIMPRLVTRGWNFVADRATHLLLLHRTRSQRAGST